MLWARGCGTDDERVLRAEFVWSDYRRVGVDAGGRKDAQVMEMIGVPKEVFDVLFEIGLLIVGTAIGLGVMVAVLELLKGRGQ